MGLRHAAEVRHVLTVASVPRLEPEPLVQARDTRWPLSRWVMPGVCAAGVVWLYWHVLSRLAHDWMTDDNYSHGIFIVPLALYFVYERRARLARATSQPTILGFLLIVGSVGLLIAATLGAELFLTRVSLLTLLTGIVLFVWGRAHARILAFPLVFLLLMIPLPAIVFNQIAFPLQLLASKFGEWALQLWRIPVLREGNVIVLANTSLEVAEACSGIRSLISLLTIGIVLGYFSDGRTLVRLLLAMATIPVAIVANGVRVAGTGIAAHYVGAEAATGFLHTFSGWLLFVSAFGLLLLVQRVIVALMPPTRGPRRLLTPVS
jgi:exosortase